VHAKKRPGNYIFALPNLLVNGRGSLRARGFILGKGLANRRHCQKQNREKSKHERLQGSSAAADCSYNKHGFFLRTIAQVQPSCFSATLD
jgi:hypothetical protein